MKTMTMTNDEPLLILKYKWWKVLWRFFWMGLIAVPLFYMLAFVWGPKATGNKFLAGEIIGILGFIGSITMLVRVLLCKGAVFFSDRIIMSWYIFGEKKLNFKDARLVGSDIWVKAMRYRVKTFYSSGYAGYLKGIKGIVIDENLLSSKDRNKLNELLAKISGRALEDFHERNISVEQFVGIKTRD